MSIQINCTSNGVITYPLHSHSDYEIIYYLFGEGVLKTEKGNIPYTPGTMVIVPPNVMHGSTSDSGFKNICVSSNFKHILNFSEPVVLTDNEKQEGRVLAEFIYENRFQNNDFLSSLCETYVLFLLTTLKIDDNISIAIKRIISEISNNAYDYEFNLKSVLLKSGYAEDYIRNQFKQKTGKTPTQFLTEIRINRARFLIDIFKDNYSMSQIAEQCGFINYIHFSKCFKRVTGCSPNEYKKRHISTAR